MEKGKYNILNFKLYYIIQGESMADLENFQKIERTTLTMEEVAEYLGISYWLVGQLVRKNELPHFRVGGRILFRKKVIDNFMEEQEKIAFDKLYSK